MDTNQFVLMAAAFMLIVTFMLTFGDWQLAPAPPQAQQGYVCRFDGFCRGNDCSAALPQDMMIFPQAEQDDPYFVYTDDLEARHGLQTVGKGEWIGQIGQGAIQLILNDNGALTYLEHEDLGPTSAIVAKGDAMCHDMSDESREQG